MNVKTDEAFAGWMQVAKKPKGNEDGDIENRANDEGDRGRSVELREDKEVGVAECGAGGMPLHGISDESEVVEGRSTGGGCAREDAPGGSDSGCDDASGDAGSSEADRLQRLKQRLAEADPTDTVLCEMLEDHICQISGRRSYQSVYTELDAALNATRRAHKNRSGSEWGPKVAADWHRRRDAILEVAGWTEDEFYDEMDRRRIPMTQSEEGDKDGSDGSDETDGDEDAQQAGAVT